MCFCVQDDYIQYMYNHCNDYSSDSHCVLWLVTSDPLIGIVLIPGPAFGCTWEPGNEATGFYGAAFLLPTKGQLN